jgi:hypothetical protein
VTACQLMVTQYGMIIMVHTNGCKKEASITCEISSSHGGEYDVQCCLLGCTAVLNDCRPTFQRYVLPPSSGMNKPRHRKIEVI